MLEECGKAMTFITLLQNYPAFHMIGSCSGTVGSKDTKNLDLIVVTLLIQEINIQAKMQIQYKCQLLIL